MIVFRRFYLVDEKKEEFVCIIIYITNDNMTIILILSAISEIVSTPVIIITCKRAVKTCIQNGEE